MPVADMIRLGTIRPHTRQELADMALSEDRAYRAALRRGDIETATLHRMEADKLAALI